MLPSLTVLQRRGDACKHLFVPATAQSQAIPILFANMMKNKNTELNMVILFIRI